MRNKRLILSIALVWCIMLWQPLQAQVYGYGSGTLITNPNLGAGVHYSDDVRARLTAFNVTTPTADYASVSISNATGSFMVGDIALLIQMTNATLANAGYHCNVRIESISGSNMVVRAIDTTIDFGSSPFDADGGANVVQIIKVLEYSNLNLDSGVTVKCHSFSYSQGHGGVLCMIVHDTLFLKGGVFDASYAGYSPTDFVTFASGGYGGNGNDTILATNYSGTYPPSQVCIANQEVDFDTLGQRGGNIQSVNYGGGAAANYVFFGDTNVLGNGSSKNASPQLFTIGRPGYYINGSGSGKGAEGGAKGGRGGNSKCINYGDIGRVGEDGGKGGDAGFGGSGGGSILVKANRIIKSNTVGKSKIFLVAGEDGKSGRNGGHGGLGGFGGLGGDGCCTGSVPIVPGGPGGYGDNGMPGNGGDGGNGGRPGTIWIASPNSIPLLGANLDVSGGKKGRKGRGGMSLSNLTPKAILYRNPCDSSICYSGSAYTLSGGISCYSADLFIHLGADWRTYAQIGCDKPVALCLIDTAFKLLAKTGVTQSITTHYIYYILSGDTIGKYYRDHALLSVKSTNADYNYGGFGGDIATCNTTFTNFAYSDVAGTPTSDSKTSFYGSDTSVYLHLGENRELRNATVCEFTPCQILNSSTYYTLIDSNYVNYLSAYTLEILGYIPPDSVTINYGDDGNDGNDGGDADTVPDPDGNVDFDNSGLAPRAGLNNWTSNYSDVKLYPNPTNGEAWLSFTSAKVENVWITITDIHGRELSVKRRWTLIKGQNKVQLSTQALSKGIYFITLSNEANEQYLNFRLVIK